MKIKYGELVEIKWIDATGEAGWQTLENLQKGPSGQSCRTVGFFLFQDDRCITLADTLAGDGKKEVSGISQIPRRWAKDIRKLPTH